MINKNDLEIIRHSLSHILAMAVLKIIPKAKLTIGPPIETGFYYDFDLPRALIPEDLETIEEKMKEIIKLDLSFEQVNESIEKAKVFYQEIDNNFKIELIDELEKAGEKEVSFYKTGDFVDLCKGPHIQSTDEISEDSFKLDKIAGAYWRGSEKNKMLQRIYGLAFESKEKLNEFLTNRKEAEKRDHKKIGPQLGLFMFHETAPGMPYWLPKGLIVLNELIKFWREEHSARGYIEVKTPLINKKELYTISGHWDHYLENMFISKTEEGEIYALKPMNCPNAMIIFNSEIHSYRELPIRIGDTDTLHRFEKSGTLNGLLRVREFSQDDAHIFITPEQIKSEYYEIFQIAERFYSIFNLEYSFRLGTRPDKFLGQASTWDKAEKELEEILEESKKPYLIKEGDGAFYGPKIDILMKDCFGREWQTGTIQLDFQLPERFNLEYIDRDGNAKRPVVIHRVIYGALERFIGLLLEHLNGAFPLWLAPVQVKVLNISEKQTDYSRNNLQKLLTAGVRAETDDSNETLGKKIRQAELEKVPVVWVIGDKEVEANQVSQRPRSDYQVQLSSQSISVEKAIGEITKQIIEKK